MKRSSFRSAAFAAAALLSACGGSNSRSHFQSQFALQDAQNTSTNDVLIQRADYNQTEITVRTSASGTADVALMEAQGYQEARDRFFQMDVLRRTGEGQLAEIFGQAALPKDIAVAAIGLREGLRRKLEALTAQHPDVLHLLEAYAAGVNRFEAEAPSTQPALLAQYQQLTHDAKVTLKPWAPVDSLAVAQNIAFYLSSDLQEKLAVGTLGFGVLAAQSQGGAFDKSKILELPGLVDKVIDLRPLENTFILDAAKPTHQAPTSLSRALKLAAPSALDAAVAPACHEWGFPFRECQRNPGFGSNNFVISKKFAGGDASFIANDPHLPLTFPMTFYELSLDSKSAGGTFHARGVNIPGIPGILIGHNDQIAWAMTNLTADVDDVYLDVLSDDGTGTVFNGDRVAMQVQPEEFQFRKPDGSLGTQTVPIRVVPHHGPVISDYVQELNAPLKALGDALGAKVVATYKWTGHAGTQEMAALLSMNRAKDWSEFRGALQNFGAGAQNMIFADRHGNIGYYAHGDFPVRKYVGTDVGKWAPYLPTPGLGMFEWEPEFRTDIPEMYNPAAGRIVSANNDPYGQTALPGGLGAITDYFGYDFADGARATRITRHIDELRGQGVLNAAVLGKVQFDHIDLGTLRLASLVKKAQARLNVSVAAQPLVQLLVDWNGDFDHARTEPVAVDAWVNALSEAYVSLAAAAPERPALRSEFHTTLFIKTLYHRLNDGLDAADASGALQVLSESLENAAKALQGSALAGKQWGDVHRLTFSNGLEGLLPLPPLPAPPRDGYYETVDVSGPGFGPNFRLIMSLKEDAPIEAVIAVPGGNYGVSDEADRAGLNGELQRYLTGQYRTLVPFAQK